MPCATHVPRAVSVTCASCTQGTFRLPILTGMWAPTVLVLSMGMQGSIPDVDISDDNDDSGTSDNGESAAALLRALARADPAVMELVKSDTYASPAATAAALPSRCCIM